MKKWENAEVVSLELNETAHNWLGLYRDGGYIGDGEISGHLTCKKPESGSGSDPDPVNGNS